MKRFTVILLLLFLSPLFGENLVIANAKEYNLTPSMEILETSDDLSIEGVVKKEGWIKNSKFIIQRGFSPNHFWFRLTIKNKGNSGNWYINFSANQIDNIDFYVWDKNRFQIFHAGDHRPFYEWSYPYSSPTAKFFLEKNEEKSIYVHVWSSSVISFMANLYNEESFAEYRLNNKQLHWFYGITEIVYILFLFIISKKTGNNRYLYLIPVTLSHAYVYYDDFWEFLSLVAGFSLAPGSAARNSRIGVYCHCFDFYRRVLKFKKIFS